MNLPQILDQIVKIARNHWEQSLLPGPSKNEILQQFHTEHFAEQEQEHHGTETTPDQFFQWYYYNHIEHKTIDQILAGNAITGSITLPKHRLIHIGEVLERERIGQQDTVTLVTRFSDGNNMVVDMYLNDIAEVWYSQDCD